MSENGQELFNSALQLSERDRAELAGLLLESLEENANDVPDAAWTEVIAQRLAELKCGSVMAIPWTEVRSHLMKNEQS
jgi:putative addiction module component (TIGR02574 family)